MIFRGKNTYDSDRNDTDGGEASPRPHRAQRLTDLLDEGNTPKTAKPSPRSPSRDSTPASRKSSMPPTRDSTPASRKSSMPPTCVPTPSPSEESEEDPLRKAIQKGLDILARGDLSARRLAEKLMEKGCEREMAIHATKYLMEKGYLREKETACRFAEQGKGKGWGPHRISEDLRAKGFAPKALQGALDSLADTDWVEACARVMAKRYREVPEDRAGRQKRIAAMMRLGYDAETVRRAMERLYADTDAE